MKESQKIVKLNAPLLVKPEQFNQHKGAQNLHKYLRAPIDFTISQDGTAEMGLHKRAALPSLSDYVYPVLMDIDPTNMVEDEYKNRHNQLFSWRMLRQIAAVDIANFSMIKATPGEETKRGGIKNFDGNIEDQALFLHAKCPKREMPTQEE